MALGCPTCKPRHTWPFDSDPYVNLLRAPSVEERLYALSFLRILAATRPDEAAVQMRRKDRFFADGLESPNKDIAKVSGYVVNGLAVATRTTTRIEGNRPSEPKAALAFYRVLMDKLFPDIRIKGGLVELHEGPQLPKVLTELEGICKDGKLGFRDSHKRGRGTEGQVAWGLRLREYEMMEAPGLHSGLLITAINGTPVSHAKDSRHGSASCSSCAQRPLPSPSSIRTTKNGSCSTTTRPSSRANKSGCLNYCDLGPVLVIYPGGIWYHYQTRADLEEIVLSHIRDGQPVERLLLTPRQEGTGPDGCGSVTVARAAWLGPVADDVERQLARKDMPLQVDSVMQNEETKVIVPTLVVERGDVTHAAGE